LAPSIPTAQDAITFPIAKSEEAFEATLKSARVHFAGKEVFRAFKEIKAYPGGNDDLCSLHALNITDKHRLILTTTHAATLTSADLGLIDPEFVNAADDPNELTKFIGSDTICRIKYHYRNREERLAMERKPATEKKANWQPPFEVCFGVSEPFEGENVILALARTLKVTGMACVRLIYAVHNQEPPPDWRATA
jgi:hypothetical protein